MSIKLFHLLNNRVYKYSQYLENLTNRETLIVSLQEIAHMDFKYRKEHHIEEIIDDSFRYEYPTDVAGYLLKYLQESTNDIYTSI